MPARRPERRRSSSQTSGVSGVDEVCDSSKVICLGRRLAERSPSLAMRLRGYLPGLFEAVNADVRELAVSFVAAAWLAELFVTTRHVENVVDDLEQHAELIGESAVRNCLRFRHLAEQQRHRDTRGDQASGLEGMNLAEQLRLARA